MALVGPQRHNKKNNIVYYGNMVRCYVSYCLFILHLFNKDFQHLRFLVLNDTVRSESRYALRLRYVDLVVSMEVAVEVCCCFTVFSC
jgi:hypothetical protein